MEYRGGILTANSDLYHHGILGQKWGRRNGPPYPLSGSAHSVAEKKAGWEDSLAGRPATNRTARKIARLTRKQNRLVKKQLKEERKQTKLQEKEQEQKEQLKSTNNDISKEVSGSSKIKKNKDAKAIVQERLKTMQTENPALYEAKKQTALQKGKASDVLKFKGNLTNQQLQDAVNRIRLEQTLSEYSSKEIKSNWDKIDDAMKRVSQATSWVNITINAFDAADRIYKKIDKS